MTTKKKTPARKPHAARVAPDPIITDHLVPGAAGDVLRITATDQPGAGGANHVYEITGFPSDPLVIEFQNGPIGEKGVNGITNEALLAVVIHRLRGFQSGPFACASNQAALEMAECCLDELQARTRERLKRGVEGKHEK